LALFRSVALGSSFGKSPLKLDWMSLLAIGGEPESVSGMSKIGFLTYPFPLK